ncbi:MAG: DUF2490 domain-containing protein [Lacibacter sp.]
MKKITQLILFFSMSISLSAQTSISDPTDVQGRIGTGFQYNFSKKIKTEIEYQARFVNNLSTYYGSYVSLEGSYDLTKKVALIANYRLSLTTNGNANRYGAGITYETKLFTKMKLNLRPMVQYKKFIADDDDVSGNSNFFVRTRLELDYSLTKKMNVYASVEPYFTFETDEYPIDNIRNTLGLKYEYAKNKKVEVYYIYRPDFAKSYNRTFHVIGVNLSFKAKRK